MKKTGKAATQSLDPEQLFEGLRKDYPQLLSSFLKMVLLHRAQSHERPTEKSKVRARRFAVLLEKSFLGKDAPASFAVNLGGDKHTLSRQELINACVENLGSFSKESLCRRNFELFGQLLGKDIYFPENIAEMLKGAQEQKAAVAALEKFYEMESQEIITNYISYLGNTRARLLTTGFIGPFIILALLSLCNVITYTRDIGVSPLSIIMNFFTGQKTKADCQKLVEAQRHAHPEVAPMNDYWRTAQSLLILGMTVVALASLVTLCLRWSKRKEKDLLLQFFRNVTFRYKPVDANKVRSSDNPGYAVDLQLASAVKLEMKVNDLLPEEVLVRLRRTEPKSKTRGFYLPWFRSVIAAAPAPAPALEPRTIHFQQNGPAYPVIAHGGILLNETDLPACPPNGVVVVESRNRNTSGTCYVVLPAAIYIDPNFMDVRLKFIQNIVEGLDKKETLPSGNFWLVSGKASRLYIEREKLHSPNVQYPILIASDFDSNPHVGSGKVRRNILRAHPAVIALCQGKLPVVRQSSPAPIGLDLM